MLPNDESVHAKAFGGPPGKTLEGNPYDVLKQLIGHVSSVSAGNKELVILSVDQSAANKALLAIAANGDIQSSEAMLELIARSGLEINYKSVVAVMNLLNKSGNFEKSIKIFDELGTKYNMLHPNGFIWASLLDAHASNKNVDEALKLLAHVEKSGIVLNADMHNPILRGLMRQGRHDEVFDLWVNMKWKGVIANKESYDIMIEQCEHQGRPERAFFLLDEMKTVSVEPDHVTFSRLFRACATAPHWVNGYQDIIFDAMCAIEGRELMPNVEVYNSVIFAFARAGDAIAAEFYLREMYQKELVPDVTSYNYVFTAYAK
jgi:pentatricopeptide repeat protein